MSSDKPDPNERELGAHGVTLVTPLVLGTTIDAVFSNQSTYRLPLVPVAWLPTEQTAQFWLSAALVAASLVRSFTNRH